MKHTLQISVSKAPPDGGIAQCRNVTVRERLMRLLLGDRRRVTVIVPGDSVKALSIVEEGGRCDDEDK
jgi:hypothetical protein